MSDRDNKRTSQSGKLPAEKSPEQTAEEFQSAIESFQSWLEENSKRVDENRAWAVRNDFSGLCHEWAKRDFWLLWDGLNLLVGRHPDIRDWESGVSELWELAVTCIGPGGSLSVANPDAKAWTRVGLAQKYRVRGVDLLDWARTKGIPVPPELASAVLGDSPEVTSEATRTKEYRKRDRLRDIRGFSEQVYQKARQAGMDWGLNEGPIAATKAEFKEFFESHMGLSKAESVALATFQEDLKHLGIRFRKGTKNRPDNDLAKLFSSNGG